MRHLLSLMLLILGLIHLMPVVGALHATKLTAMYGVVVADPNLEILLRHRAVLFGLLGGLCLMAAFRPGLQNTALVFGVVSVASFLGLAWSVGGYNAALARVVVADLLAAVCLLIAIWARVKTA